MARRRTTPPPVPDALREAVERTVQATRGGAQQARDETRTRAQDVVDEVARSTRRAQEAVGGVVKALEEARPATHDDIKAIQRELRAINRRLDAIEQRLPAKRKQS
jgi:uncharacterized protein Yka (UPF0111/DUF47 family)